SSLAVQLEELRRGATIVEWARPELATHVRAITAAVAAGLEEVPPAPIHGDLKPDHVFLAGDRVIFIDLDSVVLGDPVRDPALDRWRSSSRSCGGGRPSSSGRGPSSPPTFGRLPPP